MVGFHTQVPFFPNSTDDTHCFQASLKMVLKYFIPDKDFDFAELDKVTAKVEGKGTWPMAGCLWLKKQNFEITIIEIFDYLRFSTEKEKYLLEFYDPETAKYQIENSDLEQETKLAVEFEKAISVQKRLPTIDDIKELLIEGFVVICLVNSKKLNGKDGYIGHFVVINGFNKESFYLHDPGLPSIINREVPIKIFSQAWFSPNSNAANIMAFKLKTKF